MHDILILLRIELKRLFKSKLFYVSLFIGLALSVGGFIECAKPHLNITNGFNGGVEKYPFSVWECLWGLSLYLHLICIYLCCLQHFRIVDSSAEITRTSTFCNITAECQRIRFMLPDSLQHLSQEDL